MASSKDPAWLGLLFTWTPEKAAINLEKHKISFETAQQVFYDPHVVILMDEQHSSEEDRAYAIGWVENAGMLLVVFTDRTQGSGVETLHLISARKAEWKEKQAYEAVNRTM